MRQSLLPSNSRHTNGTVKSVEEPASVTFGRVYSLQAGLAGGLLGGLVMALLGMLQSAWMGKTIWYPANLTAAVVLRGFQSASPEQLAALSLPGFVAGMAVHFAVSAGIGLLFVLLLPGLAGNPLLWGIILSPVLWIIGYLTLSILNPVMYRSVEPVGFAVGHLLFGLVLGWWVMWREGQGHI